MSLEFKQQPCSCRADGGKALTEIANGHSVAIECLHAEEGVCHRLREMGFCESAVVEKISDNGALICKVCDTKVAISKVLAETIIVKEIVHCQKHEYTPA